MKRLFSTGLILVICLSLLSSEKSFGQSDIKTRLLKDVVKTENGRFTLQQFGFLVTIEANILEVKITSTAPANLISRDNFLNISSSLANGILASTLKLNNLTGNQDLHLVLREVPVKAPDITINITMKADGISYKATAKGYEGSNDMGWDQFIFSKGN